MGTTRRLLIVLGTAGWLVPLSISYWATYDFLANVVWPAADRDQLFPGSWHPFDVADELFYFAIAWLGAVLVAWSIVLTKGPNSQR